MNEQKGFPQRPVREPDYSLAYTRVQELLNSLEWSKAVMDDDEVDQRLSQLNTQVARIIGEFEDRFTESIAYHWDRKPTQQEWLLSRKVLLELKKALIGMTDVLGLDASFFKLFSGADLDRFTLGSYVPDRKNVWIQAEQIRHIFRLIQKLTKDGDFIDLFTIGKLIAIAKNTIAHELGHVKQRLSIPDLWYQSQVAAEASVNGDFTGYWLNPGERYCREMARRYNEIEMERLLGLYKELLEDPKTRDFVEVDVNTPDEQMAETLEFLAPNISLKKNYPDKELGMIVDLAELSIRVQAYQKPGDEFDLFFFEAVDQK